MEIIYINIIHINILIVIWIKLTHTRITIFVTIIFIIVVEGLIIRNIDVIILVVTRSSNISSNIRGRVFLLVLKS